MKRLTPSQKQLIAVISLAMSSTSNAADYVYDSLNRLVKVAYESGQTLSYHYDAAGNLRRITTVIPKYTIKGHVTDKRGDPLGGVVSS